MLDQSDGKAIKLIITPLCNKQTHNRSSKPANDMKSIYIPDMLCSWKYRPYQMIDCHCDNSDKLNLLEFNPLF